MGWRINNGLDGSMGQIEDELGNPVCHVWTFRDGWEKRAQLILAAPEFFLAALTLLETGDRSGLIQVMRSISGPEPEPLQGSESET